MVFYCCKKALQRNLMINMIKNNTAPKAGMDATKTASKKV